jgi:hypothetical protein
VHWVSRSKNGRWLTPTIADAAGLDAYLVPAMQEYFEQLVSNRLGLRQGACHGVHGGLKNAVKPLSSTILQNSTEEQGVAAHCR